MPFPSSTNITKRKKNHWYGDRSEKAFPFLLGDTNYGSKDLADAIACRKGVTITVHYEKMNGNFFAQLNKELF